ncbi:hypothetical protein GCM10009804_70960 [Kribbella hippodromi]|uniref:Secreted protein n=1 Tax=Kribbella hippodromi TaxID=434347 RepID=A0ABN2EF55_9ACTN
MRKLKAKVASGVAAGLLVTGIGAAVLATGNDNGSTTDSAFMCSSSSCYVYGQMWPGSGHYWDFQDNWPRW